MINPIDRTQELFSALVVHHKIADGKVTIKESSQVEQHAFTKLALRLNTQILDMQSFMRKCTTRYLDFSIRGMPNVERDKLDSAVAQFVRTAMDQIDSLKQAAVTQLHNTREPSFPAHKLGVVVILNEHLQAICTLSETLRAARIKNAIAIKQSAKLQYNPAIAREMARERQRTMQPQEEQQEDDDAIAPLEQQFARENLALVNQLVETRERVKEAEQTVLEIANLNHVFAAKVLEQAREIETLYRLAIEATTFVGRGNRELRKMNTRGPRIQYALAILALLLTFALLFLEWMGGRHSLFFL